MATTTVNMHEAKTHFSKLVDRVERGEEVVIARAGNPAVRMVPLKSAAAAPARRRVGFLKGQFNVPDNWDTMFEAEIEEMFYGNSDKFAQRNCCSTRTF